MSGNILEFVKQDPEVVAKLRREYKKYIRRQFIRWLYYNGELDWLPKGLKERAGKGYLSIEGLSIHHILPLSMGGKNDFPNMMLMNADKHDLIHRVYGALTYDMKIGEHRLVANLSVCLRPERLDFKKRKPAYKDNQRER